MHICRKRFFVKPLRIATSRDASNFQPSSGAAVDRYAMRDALLYAMLIGFASGNVSWKHILMQRKPNSYIHDKTTSSPLSLLSLTSLPRQHNIQYPIINCSYFMRTDARCVTRFAMQDVRCVTRDARCAIHDARCAMRDAIRDARCAMRDA